MPRAPRSPRPLAEIVCDLMTPACRKRGLANTALLLAPADLFGERWARSATVQRIIWPKGSRIDEQASTGATLVVEADSATALTLQHVAPQVVERANLIIGWPAIARLRITQVRRRRSRAPADEAPTPSPAPQSADIARQNAALSGVTHQDLKSALARLGAGIARRGLSEREKHR